MLRSMQKYTSVQGFLLEQHIANVLLVDSACLWLEDVNSIHVAGRSVFIHMVDRVTEHLSPSFL